MNVLMVGQAGVFNRGCEAIIRSTILILREKHPDLKVTLATFDFNRDSRHDFGYPVTVIPHADRSVWDKFSANWWKQKLVRLTGINITSYMLFRSLDPYVKAADVVLSIGGDNYTEDYGVGQLKNYLFLNEYISKRAKKFLIWGASVGPFSQGGLDVGVVESLQKVDKILVRENRTLEYLKSIGVTNTARVADPAFKLQKQEVPLPAFMKDKTRRTVGFNVSPLLLSYRKDASKGDIYRTETVKFLSELLEKRNVNLVLMPHVIDGHGGASDDLHYLSQIYNDLPMKERIFLPRENYNCEELKYIIANCDFYFGARTHTTIASLSSKVPTISIGYSIKAQGINEDIFGHQDFVIKSTDLTAPALLAKYEMMLSRETEIRAQLDEVIPRIQAMSQKADEYV